jgi:Spy/CpxP family protein refolding chaperone
MGPPPEALLKDAFGLSDAQLASLKTLLDTQRQAVQAILPQLAAAEKALGDAVQASNPDPSQLGTLLLAVKGFRDQIRQADAAVAAGFRGLLTADQQKKLDAYLAMKDSVPVVMALQHLGF